MKKLSVFCAGFLVGAILFGAAFCYATTGEKKVTVKYNNIKVVVDGKLVTASEEPFTMGGKTYVPLKMIADALGKNTGYEKGTVLIGVDKQSLVLTDLTKPSETGVKCSKDAGAGLKVAGQTYSKGFSAEGQKGHAKGSLKFYVNGTGMKKITGSIALDDANPEDIEPLKVQVLKDKVVVWEGELKRGDSPVAINIPIGTATDNIYFNFENLKNTKIDFIEMIGLY